MRFSSTFFATAGTGLRVLEEHGQRLAASRSCVRLRQRAPVHVVHHEAHGLDEAERLALLVQVLLEARVALAGDVDRAVGGLGQVQVDEDREARRAAQPQNERLRRPRLLAWNEQVRRVERRMERDDLLAARGQPAISLVDIEQGTRRLLER